MKKLIILSTLFLIMCTSPDQSLDVTLKNIENYVEAKDYTNAITQLKYIIENYPDTNEAAEAQFRIGNIYLNEVKDFEFAIQHLKTVIENYPNSQVVQKSMFMIGYIYANNIQAYSDAIEYYERFKILYPESDLVASVNYELDNLQDIKNEIKELIK
jgi:outer membrane protein assembly factor BamD (BamD/ComL family)